VLLRLSAGRGNEAIHELGKLGILFLLVIYLRRMDRIWKSKGGFGRERFEEFRQRFGVCGDSCV